MDSKRTIWLMAMLGGWLGGYIPALWGSIGLTGWTILFNTLGALLGIWVGYKLTR